MKSTEEALLQRRLALFLLDSLCGVNMIPSVVVLTEAAQEEIPFGVDKPKL